MAARAISGRGLRENRGVPRPTVFIQGNYEDFVWLDAQHHAELLAGLTYLRNDVRWIFRIKWMENTHSG